MKCEPCLWTPDNPDACLFCSGEACRLCGAGLRVLVSEPPCEHDAIERHEYPQAAQSQIHGTLPPT